MLATLYFAAGKDLFGVADAGLLKLIALGGSLFIVIVGFKMLGHMSRDAFGALVAIGVIAVIVGFFVLNPTGAKNTIRNTDQSISK